MPVMLYDVPGRTGTHDRPRDLRGRHQPGTPSSRSRTRSATSRAGCGSCEMGYAVYSGDDVANLGWLAHGGCGFVSRRRPRGRRRAARRWPTPSSPATTPRPSRSSPGCCPRSTPSWASPNYGATTAKAALQLLGVLDNRNVRAPARAAGRRRGGRAARRARRVRPPLTTRQGTRLEPPPPRALRAGRRCRRGVCGSSRSAVSARSVAT